MKRPKLLFFLLMILVFSGFRLASSLKKWEQLFNGKDLSGRVIHGTEK